MPDSMDQQKIKNLLKNLGNSLKEPSRLILLGGSALALLGSSRLTIDIDFWGDDIAPSTLEKAIMTLAREMKILVEPVPLHRFIPLPNDSESRRIYVETFNNLEVYIADPYSIALSKLDRGFDTDIEDIIFLIQHNYIELNELEKVVEASIPSAREFDMDISQINSCLQTVQKRLE